MSDIEMTHTTTNITNTPFENKHIRSIIDRYIRKLNETLQGNVSICDPFARECFSNDLENCITNDMNPIFPTDYNLEFKEFAKTIEEDPNHLVFDLILFDPPYSLRQLKEHYDGIGSKMALWQSQNMWKAGKDLLARQVTLGGYVISLGWTTSGFGKKRGFKKVGVHVFEQAAREDRYALLVTVEKKVQTTLHLF